METNPITQDKNLLAKTKLIQIKTLTKNPHHSLQIEANNLAINPKIVLAIQTLNHHNNLRMSAIMF